MQIFLKEIGLRLQEAIKKSGNTQKHIAKVLTINETSLVRMIKGDVDPGLSKFYRIAEYLNINYSWLFTGNGPIFYHKYNPEDDHISMIVSDNSETFNPLQDSEFTELALKIIKEEQITQEELVAAVLEVRRRRRQQMPHVRETNPANTTPVPELKK